MNIYDKFNLPKANSDFGINSFDGKYAFLSNFYDSPIEFEGIKYPTVEHCFQASKTLDMKQRKIIAAASTPGKAKRLGRQIRLRSDWEDVKDTVMRLALERKFQEPVLKQKLLDTGEVYLEEGNWWHDNYWGACACPDCRNKMKLNHLGQALMELREKLKNE